MRAQLPARSTDASAGSTPTVAQVAFQGLERFRHAANCAAGAKRRHEDIDLAAGVLPEFRAGRFAMSAAVVWIMVLAYVKRNAKFQRIVPALSLWP